MVSDTHHVPPSTGCRDNHTDATTRGQTHTICINADTPGQTHVTWHPPTTYRTMSDSSFFECLQNRTRNRHVRSRSQDLENVRTVLYNRILWTGKWRLLNYVRVHLFTNLELNYRAGVVPAAHMIIGSWWNWGILNRERIIASDIGSSVMRTSYIVVAII